MVRRPEENEITPGDILGIKAIIGHISLDIFHLLSVHTSTLASGWEMPNCELPIATKALPNGQMKNVK
jgi:hypothetical protein